MGKYSWAEEGLLRDSYATMVDRTMQEDKHNTGITGKCNGGREDIILALGLVTQQL